MKVLHFFKTYIPDSFAGVERVIWNICEGLSDSGVESSVLSLSAHHQGVMDIGTHKAFKAHLDLDIASTGMSWSVFGAFSELCADADLIHYHFPWPMMDLVHLSMRHSKPSVVTYHSDIVKQRFLAKLYAPLMHRFLGSVDAIVATSPTYLETSPVLKRWQAKTTVVPIGILDREPPGDDVVSRWRAKVGEGFFLFIGTLRYYKGLPYLLEAARLTGLPVVVLGKGEPDFDLGGENTNVNFVGEVSDEDKEALLQLCLAFVFPSHLRSEAFGVALLEAARAGRPMICCEIGTGTTYVNRNEETGFVVPPADAEALADAMRRLAADHELADCFGRAARRRYDALFHREKMCAAYRDIYAGLIGRHRGG